MLSISPLLSSHTYSPAPAPPNTTPDAPAPSPRGTLPHSQSYQTTWPAPPQQPPPWPAYSPSAHHRDASAPGHTPGSSCSPPP